MLCPAPGKPFEAPGTGTFIQYRRKIVVSRRRASLFPAPGKGQPGAGWLVYLVKNKYIFSTSNIRSTSKERCVGFTGAGESCVLAPVKLFPGAGEDWPGAGWFDLMWRRLASNNAKTEFPNADVS